jgi:hypothetical protein
LIEEMSKVLLTFFEQRGCTLLEASFLLYKEAV